MNDASWLDPGLKVPQGQQEGVGFFAVVSHFTPLVGKAWGEDGKCLYTPTD